MKPAYGLHLPVNLVRVIDGDTVEVSFPASTRVWAIRELDCWCSESRGGTPEEKARGLAAKEFTKRVCEANQDHLSVLIPAPTDPLHILSVLSMGRVLGHIYLTNDNTLADAVIKHGHGYRTKAELEASKAK